MKDHFYQSPSLSKTDLQSLIQRSNHPASLRFLALVLANLGAAVAVFFAWSGPWWSLVLALVFFGLVVCSTFAALHETAHNTAFKSKNLNRLAAQIAGLFHLYPSSIFRELHFTHHRHTHVVGKDPEISLGNKPAPSTISSLPMYLGWLSGFPLLGFKLFMTLMCVIGLPEPLRKKLFPFIRPQVRGQVAFESFVMWLYFGGILSLAIFVHSGFWAILLGQLIGHCLLASYLVMEHNGLPHEGNILEKTRSIKTNAFVRFLMWNMPYHAEHHAYPAVPFHALPSLNEQIKDELKHQDENHAKFHLKTLKRLFS